MRGWFALLSVALLLVVPLLGLARFDLWRGHHLVLGQPASARRALVALCLAGGATYLITFLVNLIGGRLFCGFGCPLAFVTRLRESARRPGTVTHRQRAAGVYLAIYALLLVAAMELWLLDPSIVTEGSLPARLAAGLALVGGTLAVLAHARWWGWSFCEAWCPVGLYYSVVAPTRSFGLHFDAATCIDCKACDHVCPVHLPPRAMLELVERDRGLAISQAPAVNHCLSCGDCIEACEMVLAKQDVPIPLTFSWHPFRDPGKSGAPITLPDPPSRRE